MSFKFQVSYLLFLILTCCFLALLFLYLCRKLFFMLQVNVLRQKTEWVKERLAIKNFKQPELIDEIISLDDERKKLQAEFDNIQSKINSSSKEIGKLMGQSKK